MPASTSDDILFADFESGTYEGWMLTGNCWGKEPASDALFPGRFIGFQGKHFLCTLHPTLGNNATGKAISKEFTIEKPFINFLIGGGYHPGEACLNLVVNDKIVRTITGNDSTVFTPATWNVSDLVGKKSHIEVIDRTISAQGGYVIVDELIFSVQPRVPEWITLPIHAVQVADDDGGRQAEINVNDVSAWVDYANRVYRDARIRFTFDPRQDADTLRSTLLNTMMGTGDVRWSDEKKLGNEIASRYRGKVVLFIRYGPGQQPVGGGFSWTDYNFVALSRAGSSTPNVLAHEAGHYLGLSHTFNRSFKTVAEAEQYIVEHGYRPDMFDGDGLGDTAPTPFIEELAETRQSSIVLAGHRFEIQVGNINSFYNGPPPMRGNTLTPMQIKTLRHVATVRLKNDMTVPPGLERPH